MSIRLNLNNPIPRSPFKIPFAWLFVFKVYSVSYFEGGWCSIHGFIAALKQLLSRVFLAMANVSLWASKLSILESGSPKITAWVPTADAGVSLDPFDIPKRMASLL